MANLFGDQNDYMKRMLTTAQTAVTLMDLKERKERIQEQGRLKEREEMERGLAGQGVTAEDPKYLDTLLKSGMYTPEEVLRKKEDQEKRILSFYEANSERTANAVASLEAAGNNAIIRNKVLNSLPKDLRENMGLTQNYTAEDIEALKAVLVGSDKARKLFSSRASNEAIHGFLTQNGVIDQPYNQHMDYADYQEAIIKRMQAQNDAARVGIAKRSEDRNQAVFEYGKEQDRKALEMNLEAAKAKVNIQQREEVGQAVRDLVKAYIPDKGDQGGFDPVTKMPIPPDRDAEKDFSELALFMEAELLNQGYGPEAAKGLAPSLMMGVENLRNKFRKEGKTRFDYMNELKRAVRKGLDPAKGNRPQIQIQTQPQPQSQPQTPGKVQLFNFPSSRPYATP